MDALEWTNMTMRQFMRQRKTGAAASIERTRAIQDELACLAGQAESLEYRMMDLNDKLEDLKRQYADMDILAAT